MVFRFTIDDWINRFVGQNHVSRLPAPISRFLGGYRAHPVADYWIWLETLVATFCGIALLEGVFKSHTVFTAHSAPMIIASYGASAILCFNANSSPLGQPRNVLMGHFISALIGVCIEKLFSLSEAGRSNYWAGGALSVGLSSVAMSIFNCVHPPGGASALLPCADSAIRKMSWWYLPVQLISSVLMICVALISGNIFRSYPTFWWTSAPTGKALLEGEDDEKALAPTIISEVGSLIQYDEETNVIEISAGTIIVPADITVDNLQREWMESLQKLLRRH